MTIEKETTFLGRFIRMSEIKPGTEVRLQARGAGYTILKVLSPDKIRYIAPEVTYENKTPEEINELNLVSERLVSRANYKWRPSSSPAFQTSRRIVQPHSGR